MKLLFFYGISFYILLSIARALLVLIYLRKHAPNNTNIEYAQDKYTIMQPILSGDRSLKNNLIENLTNLGQASFIWLIDKGDEEARQITTEIIEMFPKSQNRINIITVDNAPPGVNPKTYKLNIGLPYAKKYVVVLDDDTVIKAKALFSSNKYLAKEECLVTGIPYCQSSRGIWSNLTAAFINANSLYSYFPIALIEKPKTINGMFYITHSSTLRRLDAFKSIETKLCDDYEIARFYTGNGLNIIQGVMPCKVITHIGTAGKYFQLMKRWMIFANKYFNDQHSLPMVTLVFLPNILPLALLIVSVLLGLKYIVILFLVQVIKAGSYQLIRDQALSISEELSGIPYAICSEYLLLLHYLNALVMADTIYWRNSTVKIFKKGMEFHK